MAVAEAALNNEAATSAPSWQHAFNSGKMPYRPRHLGEELLAHCLSVRTASGPAEGWRGMGGLSHESGAIARPVFAPRPSLRLDLHLGVSSVELGVAASVPELKEARNHRFRHFPPARTSTTMVLRQPRKRTAQMEAPPM